MAQQVCKNEYIGEIVFFPQNWYSNPTDDGQDNKSNISYMVADHESRLIRNDLIILQLQQWIELVNPDEKALYASYYGGSIESFLFIISQHLVRHKNSIRGLSLRYEYESNYKWAAVGDEYTNPECACLEIICILAHWL